MGHGLGDVSPYRRKVVCANRWQGAKIMCGLSGGKGAGSYNGRRSRSSIKEAVFFSAACGPLP